jgi:hypothetical protein
VQHQRPLQLPALGWPHQAKRGFLIQRVDQFSIDIELKLSARGIADADRAGALVAGQPVGLPFG